MKRNLGIKIFIGIIIVLVIGGALGFIKFLQIRKMMATPFPAEVETIATATAESQNWQDTLTAVASIDPQSGTTLAAEIPGTVSDILVADGSFVQKGDLLLKLDASTEEAQLRAAQAQADLAKVSAERTQKLHADNTASQSELDQSQAAFKQMQANADEIRATIDKKNIRAPFAGRLGLWLVNVGMTLDARHPLISLQSLTPVYVDFWLPQQDLAQVQTGLVVQAKCDAYPGTNFSGTLTALNPDVDPTTRNFFVRATFENTNELLRPGMFVRASVMLPQAKPVLAIPSTAILSAPFGDSVFVILTAEQAGLTNTASTNLVAQQKFIRTGKSHGDFISVESGLRAGDKVATAGIFKLRNGVNVQINNVDTPKPSLNPTPPNS